MFIKWMTVLLSTMFLFSTAHQETIDGTHVSAQRERIDGVWLLVVRGTGTYTFIHEWGSEDDRYMINNLQVIRDEFVIDGYISNQKTQSRHPFFLVISKTGEILIDHVFESKATQDFSGFYPLNHGYLLHLTEVDEHTEHFEKESLIVFDEGSLETTELNREIMKIDSTSEGYHVTFKYEDRSEIFITLDGIFLAEKEVLGVENKEAYTDSVTLLFAGKASLNDTLITAPYTVNAPGHYTLIHDRAYTRFTIHPDVNGVEPGMVYTRPVQIEYAFGQAVLNHEPYASNELISIPGTYTFGMYIEDYIYEIPFTLKANVTGIKHLETYDEPVTIQFSGEGYLNNQFIHSGHVVSEPGRYTLKVFGVNQYLETHTFEIKDIDATSFNIEWVEMGLLGGSVVLGAGLIIDSIVRRIKKKRP